MFFLPVLGMRKQRPGRASIRCGGSLCEGKVAVLAEGTGSADSASVLSLGTHHSPLSSLSGVHVGFLSLWYWFLVKY